ncbi:LuxR C-terminal-related transcriptional regulator [Kitasatospora sp. NPDC059811]|uniref:response regulator transcription factor n=1 Tax=Streptomycetaceae TaxID=2062 RepID=UPI0007AEF63F|nr:LuxR C-terminal-related transcriptional regulator [Streptomyces sp. MJM8645]
MDVTVEVNPDTLRIAIVNSAGGPPQTLLLPSGGHGLDGMRTRASTSTATAPATLTEQERAVLDLLAEGLPNTAIAERLGLAVSTVKTYASRINTKLGVTSRLQAALLFQRFRAG